MVICDVCRGETFYNESGLFYCKDCHTQIEGWREEDAELDAFLNQKKTGRGSTAFAKLTHSKNVSKTNDLLAEPEEYIRPWATWEGFNQILVSQVTEMENLPGVAPGFKFAVLSLWTRYLHCKGYAFLADSALPSSKLASCKRDHAVLTSTKLSLRKYKRKLRKKDHISNATSDSSVSAFVQGRLRSALASQLYAESAADSSRLQLSQDMESFSQANSSRLSCSANSSTLSMSSISVKDERILKKDPNIKRQHLLAILYLGLLVSGSEVTMGDFCRWLEEERISYSHISCLLPDEMILGIEDVGRFGYVSEIPPPFAIKDFAKKMCPLLGVTVLPIPDVVQLARRYIIDFNLPEALVSHGEKLWSLISEKQHKRASNILLPNSELTAMALVIVLLKLHFGIDGLTEQLLSRKAAELNTKCPADGPETFCWDQWVCFIEARNTFLSSHWHWAQMKLEGPRSTSRNLCSRSRGLDRDPPKRYNIIRDVPRRYLTAQLQNLNSSHTSPSTQERSAVVYIPPSLHPMSSALQMLLSQTDGVKNTPPEILYKSFKDCQVYQQKSETSTGGSDVVVASKLLSCMPVRKINAHSRLSTLERRTVQLSAKKNEPWRTCTVERALTCNQDNACCHYWHMPIPHRLVHTSSITTEVQQIVQDLPQPFLWLLTQCTRFIGETAMELYAEVCSLELVLFQDLVHQ